MISNTLNPKNLVASADMIICGRYTMDRPRFSDHLEAIKFICKDFWSELFKKQIDNLKTNHRVSREKFERIKSWSKLGEFYVDSFGEKC